MSEIGRFGVFLPSYIWEGDGADRARGIKEFARTVEDLGFDSLFVTDHLLVGKRFYSVNWLEPLTTLAVAAGATERVRLGTSVLVMPLRDPVILAKELATLQFLSTDRVVLGAGVGWNDAEYEAVGVHKSERGKRTDEMLDIMMPLLEGEHVTYHGTFYSVDDVFIEPRTSQRPLLWIGGGSQLADPKSPDVPRFVESVKRRTVKADGWIPRPTCPPQDIARDWAELQAAMRGAGRDPQGHARRPRELPPPRPDRRSGQGPRATARGVPQGDEQRAGAELPRIGVPVRHARRDHRLAPGTGRCRRRVLLPPHHDPGPEAAPGLGRSHHPERHVPDDGGPGPPPAPAMAPDGSRRRMTRRVALLGKPLRRRHSQVMHDAAFEAAGIDARYVLRELDPDEVARAVAEARGEGWLGLGVTAPYKQVVAALCDDVEPEAATIGAVNNVVRRDDGSLIGFNSDAPGFRAGVELAMGRSLEGTRVVVVGAGGAAHAVVFACLAAGASQVTVTDRTPERAAALVERFASLGTGTAAVVDRADAAFERALGAADLAVNATTVGMIEPGVTIPVEALPAGATVFDLVYVPAETDLAPGGPGARSAGRERVGDADRPGRHRLRALDRHRWHGRRHARRGRTAPRR